MDGCKLLIKGGGKPLYGTVRIAGAKNAALPILCASLLTKELLVLRNLPDVEDVRTMLQLLREMGVEIRFPDPNDRTRVILQASKIKCTDATDELAKTMHASILVLGPLLSRFGSARISLPGGCAIGERPVDQHIKGLRMMGAQIEIEDGYIKATRVNTRLQGARIVMDTITVTGTENLLMAAVLAKGQTDLEHAAMEPEVTDLAMLLVTMGAKIKGIGSNHLVIQGVHALHGTEYEIIPDRIETGTFLCAVAVTGGEITLENCRPDTLDDVIAKLEEAGLSIKTTATEIHAVMEHRPKAVSFETSEYPGFPTDMQAPFMALNSVALGNSSVTENIFENRFMHVQELNRLGAHISISIDGKTAYVEGVQHLSGATVKATDLRAAASLVIAGLVAVGETLVEGINHLDRGYDKMECKLRALGADIQRVI